ncbi:MAG: bifunctional phosphoglucose/phosphomannose isomerase [Candidatus Pacebacteria bacterium]|nr:bifunctional phosphoglucose/phosphomannose isomerase [Candidatus Paceibacterota bacterium]
MEVTKIDKSNMRKTILDFPKQFKVGVNAAKKTHLEKWSFLTPPENIIVCGMGGSALPGDILVTLRPLDVFSYKSYRLPLQAGNESLIICISYSGNTEETLSSFETAVGRNLPVISITTGGKLAELSKKYKVPCVILPPPYVPPRLALGQMFAALLQVLKNHNLLDDPIINDLLKLGNSLKPADFELKGKKIAKEIFGRIPIIYNSRRFRVVGTIWKNSLNETAKILALANYFPELNHNEIVGLWRINESQISNDKIYVLILRDKESSHPRILKQMEITKNFIEKEGIGVEFIEIKGKNLLEKFFSTIILGFWTSFWLAMEYKVDPTQIKPIDEFKRKLKEK